MKTTYEVCYGDFANRELWPDTAIQYQIACERRWRTAGTDEVIACAERELQRRKKEAHGQQNV